ncbi:MAG: hypothetical protein RL110_929 [Bacteroidota bacterium]|jgi:hypothetical protein
MRNSLFFLFVVCSVLLSSCEKYRFWNLAKLAAFNTPVVSNNSVQSFQVRATLQTDGFTDILRAGFVWSDVNALPTLNDNVAECVLNQEEIQAQIPWPVNTQFYLRAFVENKIGVQYSEPLTVNWPGNASNLPELQTINPNQIGFFECSINGLILTNGGLPITEQGFCFSSSNQSPTLLNSTQLDNSGNTSFSALIANLNENTTYYLRAYAKNLQGVGYGNVITLTTNNYLYPGEVGNYGGLIFYAKTDTLGGWNFLEAAPSDCNGNAVWAFNNNTITTSLALGAGPANTLSIVQQLGPANPPYAAFTAYNYPSGSNGWSLPSRDELMKMRENLYLNQLGNFTADARYWSSSQDTNFPDNAWAVKMTSNASNTASYAKSNAYKVRAIRRY